MIPCLCGLGSVQLQSLGLVQFGLISQAIPFIVDLEQAVPTNYVPSEITVTVLAKD